MINTEVRANEMCMSLELSEVSTRHTPARVFPVKHKQGGAASAVSDADVLGDKVPVHERRRHCPQISSIPLQCVSAKSNCATTLRNTAASSGNIAVLWER